MIPRRAPAQPSAGAADFIPPPIPDVISVHTKEDFDALERVFRSMRNRNEIADVLRVYGADLVSCARVLLGPSPLSLPSLSRRASQRGACAAEDVHVVASPASVPVIPDEAPSCVKVRDYRKYFSLYSINILKIYF